MRTEEVALVALASLAGEVFLWYWLVRGDGFDVTSWIVSDFLTVLNAVPEQYLNLLWQLGQILHEERYQALVFKKNAGKYVGNYNYRKLTHELLRTREEVNFLSIRLGQVYATLADVKLSCASTRMRLICELTRSLICAPD